jgi:hypothetical protein
MGPEMPELGSNTSTVCVVQATFGIFWRHSNDLGTAVAQWLRYCSTNQKVADSIPAAVIGNFHSHKSFRSHYGPGFESACNRNEYQEYFLGVNAAGA